MKGITRQKAVSRHKTAGTLPTRAAQIHTKRKGRVAVRVIAPNVGGVLVDDAPSVRLRVTGVIFAMVSMAAEARTVR
jgi:hypothetical protein